MKNVRERHIHVDVRQWCRPPPALQSLTLVTENIELVEVNVRLHSVTNESPGFRILALGSEVIMYCRRLEVGGWGLEVGG